MVCNYSRMSNEFRVEHAKRWYESSHNINEWLLAWGRRKIRQAILEVFRGQSVDGVFVFCVCERTGRKIRYDSSRIKSFWSRLCWFGNVSTRPHLLWKSLVRLLNRDHKTLYTTSHAIKYIYIYPNMHVLNCHSLTLMHFESIRHDLYLRRYVSKSDHIVL